MFDESQHRRDRGGKFAHKPVAEVAGGTAVLTAPAGSRPQQSRAPIPADSWGELMRGPWPELPPEPPPFEETVFIGSAFKHHVSPKRMYRVVSNPIEFRPDLYPSRAEGRQRPSLYVGYGSDESTVPLEILASYDNDGKLVVFHALRARDRTCRELGYSSLQDFINQNPPARECAA